jgi:hypothetical protein
VEITLQAPTWTCAQPTPTGPCLQPPHLEGPHMSETDQHAATATRRPAAQLRAEVDWIHNPELGPDPVQVAAVFPWPTTPKVSIAYWGTDGEPRMFTAHNDVPYQLAADVDVAAILHRRSRHAAVEGLGEVVALLEKPDFPIPAEDDRIGVTVPMPTRAALEQAVQLLGVQVLEGDRQASATWLVGRSVEVVLFHTYPAVPPPADWSRSTVSGRDIELDDTVIINRDDLEGYAIGRNGRRS